MGHTDLMNSLETAKGPSPSIASVDSVREALGSLAPHAPDAQPKRGILHRVYGDANTHYMGQGASLR